MSRENTC